MVDGIEVSNMSSVSLFNNVVNISGTPCLSCVNLKSELQTLQDELKTAQLIKDLLQKEVMSKKCVRVY
jgi:hypothetical protein